VNEKYKYTFLNNFKILLKSEAAKENSAKAKVFKFYELFTNEILKLSKLFQKLFFHQKALLKFESLITNI
jgi:hypothetical protein